MNVFVLSHRCGHCVRQQVVMGDEEYEACWRECVGAPCPVCGARAREGDLQIIVLDKDVNAIKNGSFPWGKTSRPTGGFAGFGGTGTAPETERGGFASALRKEMYGQSERSRKQEYRALSEAFTKLSGFQFGFEAYEKGDLDRAVLWLQRAAQVLDDPTHAAGACMYLGLTWVKKGEPHKAEKAFRDAVDRTDADPTIRSGSADQLGSVLKQLGDIAGARKAFQLAVDLGVPHFASKAAVNLGTLEDEAGNHDKARSLWEFAYESPDDTGGFAAHNLGWYWEQAGDVKKARRFYKIAAKSSTPQVATRAAERLRVLPASSRRLFRRDR